MSKNPDELSEREAALMANPKLVEAIKKGIRQAEEGKLIDYVVPPIYVPDDDGDEPFTEAEFSFDSVRVLTDEEWDRLTDAVVDVVFEFADADGEKLFETGSAHRSTITWNEREAKYVEEYGDATIANQMLDEEAEASVALDGETFSACRRGEEPSDA